MLDAAIRRGGIPGLADVGAYETDPKGPRTQYQATPDYPAGYRDPTLYKRLWGTVWNGVPDSVVLGWCQGQFMWNMLAGEREEINKLAVLLLRCQLCQFRNGNCQQLRKFVQ